MDPDTRIRIAIGHPTMGRGGSEARVMWLIQALKEKYNVTLITTRNVDLNDLNDFYGTSVRIDEITVRIAPVPFFMKENSGISALRGAFYNRFTRKVGKEYDLCISAYNFSCWGVSAIHFIADFVWDHEIRDRFLPVASSQARLIHKDGILRKLYLGVARRISGPKQEVASVFSDKFSQVFANSDWVAGLIQDKYGYACDGVVYPPVRMSFEEVSHEKKIFAFVSIGRIAPEKLVEQQICILEKVRELGHELQFHLIGGINEDPYGQRIRRLCDDRSWITIEGRRSGAEKVALLTGCKFAIHSCPHEAFGITVAEMVKAGCIPFVPNTGGQTEIVPFEELQFSSVSEAVQKIDAMLADEDLQREMLNELSGQKSMFSAEMFCAQAKEIVCNWLHMRESNPSGSNSMSGETDD